MFSPFPCSPVIGQWSWKKTPIEKKKSSCLHKMLQDLSWRNQDSLQICIVEKFLLHWYPKGTYKEKLFYPRKIITIILKELLVKILESVRGVSELILVISVILVLVLFFGFLWTEQISKSHKEFSPSQLHFDFLYPRKKDFLLLKVSFKMVC